MSAPTHADQAAPDPTPRPVAGRRAEPLDPQRLDDAVAAGVLSQEQAGRLADFWVDAREDDDVSVSHVDAEEVRFARGFHDVFIAIGIAVLLFGLSFALSDAVSLVVPAGVVAAVIWGLSEVFARRMRLALPSFLLTIAFAPAFLLAAIGLSSGADNPGDALARQPETLLMLLPTFLGFAGGALHYWRFRVPVGVAVIAATLLLLAAVPVEVAAPGFLGDHPATFSLIAGLACFAAAMRFDARDLRRATVASDKAFWLHLLAAPLIAHSVLGYLFDELATQSALASAVVICSFLALAFVAVVVDRRALLVSGLSYFGVAIGQLLVEADVSSESALAMALIVLGGFILILGSAWRVVRRLVGRAVTATPIARYVPAFD
jgi:hypothetical protein